MPVKQFSDTSAVSLAYAIDNAANAGELTATTFNYVPYTTEGFSLSKESQSSAAITDDRRPNGSKNTSGSASGSLGTEMGYAPFILDMLKLSMMGDWKQEMEPDGITPTGANFIVDGETPQFFVAEKRVRKDTNGTPMNYLERYFGNLVNEMSIEIGNGELISFTVNTMAAFGDINSADATSDEDAGGLVTTYTQPASYEIADSANNIANMVLKDSAGSPLPVVWSDLSIQVTNNAREQAGVGNEFAAGMALGKVAASVSGTIYFYDDTLLNTHLNNNYVSLEVTLSTGEGSLVIHLPKLKLESPTANSQGENQDYTQSVTLNAERGSVMLSNAEQKCVIAIVESAV